MSSTAHALGTRLAVALAIGVAAALWWLIALHSRGVPGQPGYVPSDFEFWWRASRLAWTGVDPYPLRQGMPGWPLPDPIYYPGTALVVTGPIAWLPLAWAGALFVGGSAAVLAWMLTADGQPWRLWMLASPGVLFAGYLGQWSLWLTAAILVPSVSFLFTVKPTIGLAGFASRPTFLAYAGGVVIFGVSLALVPTWPLEWWADIVHPRNPHPIPITTPWGVPALIAAFRWRDRDARLLLVMACVPQILYFADQLPLLLVARTKRELVSLIGASVAGVVAASVLGVRALDACVILGCYLPALAVVLFRPSPEAIRGAQAMS